MPVNGKNLGRKSGANKVPEYRTDSTPGNGYDLIIDLVAGDLLLHHCYCKKKVGINLEGKYNPTSGTPTGEY